MDLEKERERIEKEIVRLNAEIERAESKLSNEGFLAKAPRHVVEEERVKLLSLQDMLKKVQSRMKSL